MGERQLPNSQGNPEQPQQIEAPGSSVASALAGMLLRENYDKGKTITIPSLGIVLSKVREALPESPKTAEQVAAAFRATFPDAPVISLPEDNPTEVIVEYKGTEKHSNWSEVYAAVNEVGSIPHTNDVQEHYRVVQGELVVMTKRGRDPIKEHTLQEAGEITIEPGVIHAAKAKEEWTIFVAASYPGLTSESHHIASQKVIAQFRSNEHHQQRLNPFKRLLKRGN